MKRLAVLLGIVCVLVWVVDGDAQRRLGGVQRGGSSGAGDPLRQPTTGGGVSAAGEAYLLYWDGECSGNSRTDAKLTAGTCGGITGTLSGAEIINTDESSYYLYTNAINEYLRFASASVTNYDPDEFYVRVLVKKTGTTAESNAIAECYTDVNSRWNIYVSGATGVVNFKHSGASGVDSVNVANDNSVESLQDGYWGVVEVKYSTTNSVAYVRVCSTAGSDCLTCDGSEPWDTTTDSGQEGYADMAATPTYITIGEDIQGGSMTNTIKIDKFEVRTYANAP